MRGMVRAGSQRQAARGAGQRPGGRAVLRSRQHGGFINRTFSPSWQACRRRRACCARPAWCCTPSKKCPLRRTAPPCCRPRAARGPCGRRAGAGGGGGGWRDMIVASACEAACLAFLLPGPPRPLTSSSGLPHRPCPPPRPPRPSQHPTPPGWPPGGEGGGGIRVGQD